MGMSLSKLQELIMDRERLASGDSWGCKELDMTKRLNWTDDQNDRWKYIDAALKSKYVNDYIKPFYIIKNKYCQMSLKRNKTNKEKEKNSCLQSALNMKIQKKNKKTMELINVNQKKTHVTILLIEK